MLFSYALPRLCCSVTRTRGCPLPTGPSLLPHLDRGRGGRIRFLSRQLLSEQEPVGLLIGAARRRIKQAVGHRLRGHGLTPQQFWVLINVREREGLALHELAARLRLDQPTTSRIVSLLRRRKLVRMGGHPGDRRRCCLGLSASGRELVDRLRPLAREVREAVVHGMSATEQDRLRRLLRQVMANMERFETAAPAPHEESPS